VDIIFADVLWISEHFR